MQVFIKNNIRIRGLLSASPLKLEILDALTMPNPEYLDRQKKRRSTWGIKPKLELFLIDQGDIVTGRGFLDELQVILQRHKINPFTVIEKQFNEGLAADFGEWKGWDLREYQKPAVASIIDSNGVLVSPAGSGKTLMGMRYIWTKGRCTVWLTHTADLMKQARDNAEKYLGGVGKVGIIGNGVTNWGDGKLIICMAQTLAQNPQLVETLDRITGTLVIDEAHHFPAPLFMEVANRISAANFVGLTATPDRKDGLERFLYVGIGSKRYEVPREVLHKAGQLIIPEVRFIYTAFSDDPASQVSDMGAVDAGGEDLDYSALVDAVIHDQERIKLVARSILDNAPGNYSLVLTESVRYCYYLRDAVAALARELRRPLPRMAVVHGPITRYVWRTVINQKRALQRVAAGDAVESRYNDNKNRWEVRIEQYTENEMESWKCTPTQRGQHIQDMREKRIDILFATQLAREGLDIPHLNVEHMAMSKRGDTHTTRKDGSAVEQEAGRIQRPDPNNPNKRAILFDYVDYNVGVFKDQYYSRRAVYKRLGFKVPKKPKTTTDDIDAFLSNCT